jgi:hypothetical protein
MRLWRHLAPEHRIPMTQSRLFALFLAVPLWHGHLLGQQALDQSASAPLPPTSISQALGDFAALQRDEGLLVGAGADYRVRFDRNGAQFTPALGELAPIEFPVTLRGVAFGRGAASKALDAVEPTFRDRTASFRHGAVDETYEVRANGLKQSFVFHERPMGQGDLVVAVQVATQLALQSQGDNAVTFGNEYGGVRIDTVLGIDALGNTCTGSLSYAGDQLQLRLPAAFVDRAALPLVLDPMLGAVIPATTGGRNLDPQAAYDSGLARYLVVFWRRYSSSTGDIYGQFVHRETTAGADLSGASVVIRFGANSQRARVADCSVRNAFVVGWQDTMAVAPLPTHRDLFVRGVSPTTLGAPMPIAAGLTDDNSLEMAGNATESSSDGALRLAHRRRRHAHHRQHEREPQLHPWRDGDGQQYWHQHRRAPAAQWRRRQPLHARLAHRRGHDRHAHLRRCDPGRHRQHALRRAVLHGLRARRRRRELVPRGADARSRFDHAERHHGDDVRLEPAGPTSAMPAGHRRRSPPTPVCRSIRPTVAMSGRNAVVAWTQGSTTQVLGLRTFGQSLCAAVRTSDHGAGRVSASRWSRASPRRRAAARPAPRATTRCSSGRTTPARRAQCSRSAGRPPTASRPRWCRAAVASPRRRSTSARTTRAATTWPS